MACAPDASALTRRRGPRTPPRPRLPLVAGQLRTFVPNAQYPDDLLYPVEFNLGPERRDILEEFPVPSNLPQSLVPPPLPRSYYQMIPPPMESELREIRELRLPADFGPAYEIDEEALEELNLSNIREAIEEIHTQEANRQTVERGWAELQNRECPDLFEDGGSFLDDSLPTSNPIRPRPIELPPDLDEQPTSSFVVSVREGVVDPAARFQRLQELRQSRFPRQPSPDITPIDEEMMCFPHAINTPPRPVPTPPPLPPTPLTPTTQMARGRADLRFHSLMNNPRNYYDIYQPAYDPRRRFAPSPVVDLEAEQLEDFNYCIPESPTRALVLDEEIRAAVQARIQAVCAGETLPSRPRIEELAQLNVSGPINNISPEDEEEIRLAARLTSNFMFYPQLRDDAPLPANMQNIPSVFQDCSIELNDSGRASRGPRRRFSTPGAPQREVRLNRSLPRSHTYRPFDPMQLRESDILDESQIRLLDRSLNNSELEYINLTHNTPRTQRCPGERRRSRGLTPPRPFQGRGPSLPRFTEEERAAPIRPETYGIIPSRAVPERSLTESELEFVRMENLMNEQDRLLSESDLQNINLTNNTPRTQRCPGERRRSCGLTPPRFTGGRGLSLPMFTEEERAAPIRPETYGVIPPKAVPERSLTDSELEFLRLENLINQQDRSLSESPARATTDLDNVLDISQIEGGTRDCVQVQGPNKRPWKISIKLMAPGSSSETQPGPSRISRPGPSRISRPSGIRPPGSSGIRPPGGTRPPSQLPARVQSQTEVVCPPPTTAVPYPDSGMRHTGAIPRRAIPQPSRIRRGSQLALPTRVPSQSRLRPPYNQC